MTVDSDRKKKEEQIIPYMEQMHIDKGPTVWSINDVCFSAKEVLTFISAGKLSCSSHSIVKSRLLVNIFDCIESRKSSILEFENKLIYQG